MAAGRSVPESAPGPGPAMPNAPGRPIVLDDVKRDPEVEVYLTKANEYTGAIGYTEHGFRHATLVSNIAGNIMRRLEHGERQVQLAAIAAYLHDIGNVAGRVNHETTGALLASRILGRLGMDPTDMAVVMGAIGNHEEQTGDPVSDECAALILADKSDVHRTRVRNPDPITFDIHDRVNYAVEHSFLRVDAPARSVTLELTIDTRISQVMEYFEIFLPRMVMCRRAAQWLQCQFRLQMNGTKLL